MGILAVHITTVKIRDTRENQVALGYLGHPGQIGGWWVPQNDVTMEAVRADDNFPPPLNFAEIGRRTARGARYTYFGIDSVNVGAARIRLHGQNTAKLGVGFAPAPALLFASPSVNGGACGCAERRE